MTQHNPEHDLPPSLLHYKWDKLLQDYRRVHDLLNVMSPSHFDLDANKGSMRLIRQAVEDLLGDIAAVMDLVFEAAATLHHVPGAGRDAARRAALASADPGWSREWDAGWDAVFDNLNEVRNDFEHSAFLENNFGVFQPGSPMVADFVARVERRPGRPIVYVMRDVRRAARRLHRLASIAGIAPALAAFEDPCPTCVPDP